MLIFLFGSDTFRSQEKLSQLKKQYLTKSSGADLSILEYGEKGEIKKLSEILSARGLFSSKQLIIIKNICTGGSTEQQKELLAFLKSQSSLKEDVDSIIIFFEAGAPKKNGSLYKFLISNTKKQEFPLLDGVQLSNWALSETKRLSPETNFSKPALSLLLAATGNNLYVLSNEITKLVSFKTAGIIEIEDIEALVKSKIDSTMFQTIEALVSGNKTLALKLLHEQIAKGEDIYYILSMYTYQIRTLLKIGDFYWQGMTSAPQIAQASGIHPYVVQKSLGQLRNLTQEKTKQMLRDLAEIDQNAKTGKVEPLLALDSFIVSI